MFTTPFPLLIPSSRIIHIQTEMAQRAVELLALPEDGTPKLILDLGCGSGLAGSVLEDMGHAWIGSDISPHMLTIARERFDEAGDDSGAEDDEDVDMEGASDALVNDVFLQDMGEGVGFRPGTFDGCVSISALQWLCHSNRSRENPRSRLARLFSTLFAALRRGARAIFQFYPENADQIDLILAAATKAGFTGGLVVDYPNSARAKKYYLCLMTGVASALPQGREGDEAEEAGFGGASVGVAKRTQAAYRERLKERKRKEKVKDRSWVMAKKDLYRKRGLDIAEDSKYTARKRRPKF